MKEACREDLHTTLDAAVPQGDKLDQNIEYRPSEAKTTLKMLLLTAKVPTKEERQAMNTGDKVMRELNLKIVRKLSDA